MGDGGLDTNSTGGDAGDDPDLGLPAFVMGLDGVEYYGGVGFLKAGLQAASAITTVSPTYAREIQTEALGMGLDGVLRPRFKDLYGILNGIDTATNNHDAGQRTMGCGRLSEGYPALAGLIAGTVPTIGRSSAARTGSRAIVEAVLQAITISSGS